MSLLKVDFKYLSAVEPERKLKVRCLLPLHAANSASISSTTYDSNLLLYPKKKLTVPLEIFHLGKLKAHFIMKNHMSAQVLSNE